MTQRPSVSIPTFDAQKQQELRRMRGAATALLIAVTLIFLLASRMAAARPWLAYIRAFAEAATVGACADWFAVVALFRRPLGLPIPHTGIIPRNRERLSEALGRFMSDNFLTPSVLARRLRRVDAARQLNAWLSVPGNTRRAAAQVTHILQQLLQSQSPGRLADGLTRLAIRGIEALPAASLAGRLMSIAWAQRETQELLDRGLALAGEALLRHKEFIRQKVTENSWPVMPRWVDGILTERITRALHDTVEELRDPEHPFRAELQRLLDSLIFDLANNPATQARGESIKTRLLDDGEFRAQLERLCQQIAQRFEAGVSRQHGPFTASVEATLNAFAQLLQTDDRLRALLNRWVHRAALRSLAPQRGNIADFISGVMATWGSTTLVQKLELHIGADLQYIRINGTLVGGLVGLLLFVVSKWVAGS